MCECDRCSGGGWGCQEYVRNVQHPWRRPYLTVTTHAHARTHVFLLFTCISVIYMYITWYSIMTMLLLLIYMGCESSDVSPTL